MIPQKEIALLRRNCHGQILVKLTREVSAWACRFTMLASKKTKSLMEVG